MNGDVSGRLSSRAGVVLEGTRQPKAYVKAPRKDKEVTI